MSQSMPLPHSILLLLPKRALYTFTDLHVASVPRWVYERPFPGHVRYTIEWKFPGQHCVEYHRLRWITGGNGVSMGICGVDVYPMFLLVCHAKRYLYEDPGKHTLTSILSESVLCFCCSCSRIFLYTYRDVQIPCFSPDMLFGYYQMYRRNGLAQTSRLTML